MPDTATIVMIEDSPTEAAIARAVLAGDACRMQVAPTGTAGIRLVERLRPTPCCSTSTCPT